MYDTPPSCCICSAASRAPSVSAVPHLEQSLLGAVLMPKQERGLEVQAVLRAILACMVIASLPNVPF